MTEPKIHISRAIWDEDTHEVAYIVDGVMTADVATQRKLNAVDDMYEALSNLVNKIPDDKVKWDDLIMAADPLRKARGEED